MTILMMSVRKHHYIKMDVNLYNLQISKSKSQIEFDSLRSNRLVNHNKSIVVDLADEPTKHRQEKRRSKLNLLRGIPDIIHTN